MSGRFSTSAQMLTDKAPRPSEFSKIPALEAQEPGSLGRSRVGQAYRFCRSVTAVNKNCKVAR